MSGAFIGGGGGGGTSSPLTTKGDIYTYDTADARLPVSSTNGNSLISDSSESTGLKYRTVGYVDGYPFLHATEGFEIFSHCIEIPNTAPFIINISGGDIANNAPIGDVNVNPGQWRFNLNASNGRSRLEAPDDSNFLFQAGTGKIVLISILNCNLLSDATNEYRMTVGCVDGRNNDTINNGMYFEYDRTVSTNWSCVTEIATVRTVTDSGIAVATGSFNKFEIIVNAAGSSVEFYINDALVATNITNIPTVVLNNTVYLLRTVGSANQNIFYLDWIYIRKEFV